jgi:dihydropteroate synthase
VLVTFAPRRAFSIPLPTGHSLELGSRTLVMAIVNVTPDSFADGGVRFDPDVAIRDALAFVEQGADILDIGGESTRPGAAPLPADEEMRRVLPVISAVSRRVHVPVSIDTYKAEVAARALDCGASIVNDVSGLALDGALGQVVAAGRAALVLMHSRGRSSDMYRLAEYRDVAAEVAAELGAAVGRAESAGVDASRIILDPGLGFAKRAEHTLEMVRRLPEIANLGRPILVGPSRKSFLKAAVGELPPGDRLWSTAAAVTASVLLGAHIVRVHDVKEMVDVVRTADAIRNN